MTGKGAKDMRRYPLCVTCFAKVIWVFGVFYDRGDETDEDGEPVPGAVHRCRLPGQPIDKKEEVLSGVPKAALVSAYPKRRRRSRP